MKHALSAQEGRAWLDIVSHGRAGPSRRDRLTSAQRDRIARTVNRAAEVMIKVSGGGRSGGAVKAHLEYIGRRGDLEIETDDGERLRGRDVPRRLVDEWRVELDAAAHRHAALGAPGRRATKLAHNIVLSMPAGTPPDKLLAASREFAREKFALRHRYAMVLHTDQEHPHVHLVVKAISEQGARMYIRKATLREWREDFARYLRAQGIAANATPRAIRGVTKPRKKDGIHRAMLRGASTHMRARVTAVAREIRERGEITVEPGKATLLTTRRAIERRWNEVAALLVREGQQDLALQVDRFVSRMPRPNTDKEQIAEGLRTQLRATRCDEPQRT